jgi:hypothetical protein
LIQQNGGPYLAARTKIEKSEAIALIVDKVNQASPYGGFIKKDSATGRWYRIKENEARDKVGHAIRKAVQRLEETKPKLAARIKKEYTVSSSQAEEGKPARGSPSPRNAVGSTQRPSLVATSQHENKEEGKLSPRVKTVEPTTSSEVLRTFAGRHALTPSAAMAHSALSQDATKIALEQLLGSTSSTGGAFSARHLLAGFPAMANSLPGRNVSIFPSLSDIASVDDPARLVAASLLVQRTAPLSHAYNQYIGLNPAPASANKLWLTAALRQQQETHHKAKELKYARRLALTALQDLSQSAAVSSGETRTRGRKTSMDGEDNTSRS